MAATAVDLRVGRVPNLLVGAALAFALAAAPAWAVVAGAIIAPLPLLLLAVPRLAGMGDVKFASPVGALLAGEAGLVAVPWWWAWSLLGAAITLTVAAFATHRRAEAPPLTPALLLAALVGLLSG